MPTGLGLTPGVTLRQWDAQLAVAYCEPTATTHLISAAAAQVLTLAREESLATALDEEAAVFGAEPGPLRQAASGLLDIGLLRRGR